MKVSERTIIDKIYKGIDNNGWSVLNGLGTGRWNGAVTNRSMAQPLIDYLKKNGIVVTK